MPEPRVSTGKVEPVAGQIELPFGPERGPDYHTPAEIVVCGHKQAPWLPHGCQPPMTMQISQADQDHQDEMRARSYRLAIERGHLRR